MFGMYSSQDDMQETFDVEDEEAAAVWDLDDIEVEKLRAAPSQSQRDSMGGGLSGLLGETPAGGVKQGGLKLSVLWALRVVTLAGKGAGSQPEHWVLGDSQPLLNVV